MTLTELNARRSALRTVRLAYRKVLTKRTDERLAAWRAARSAAIALGCTMRECNDVVRAEWARRELELIRRDERKAGLCA